MSAAKASKFRRTFVQIWIPQHRCPPNLFGKALTQLFAFRGTRQCGISAITQIFAIMAVLQVKCVQCLFSASSYKSHALGIKLRLSTCDHQPCSRLCSDNLARTNVETANMTIQTPRRFIAQVRSAITFETRPREFLACQISKQVYFMPFLPVNELSCYCCAVMY